jgi:exodeoxyribonuclease VII large subunit
MASNLKSQWEFGELFPVEATRQVLTVTQLTASVRKLLEGDFPNIWVTGEITNLRVQSSGHLYFSLKDAGAQLACILFRNNADDIDRALLEDGQKVIVQGSVTVYDQRGQYQLRVSALELQGMGALQAAFEKLKNRLQKEGLFALERKRPIPRFPRRIGIVTSSSGAALRDVLHVFGRRHPGIELVLANCRVQGQGAGEEIACAIELLNHWSAMPREDLQVPNSLGFSGRPRNRFHDQRFRRRFSGGNPQRRR